MKLIYAIIRNDNEDDVVSALMQEHFFVTRLSTTGGFLRKGNTTLMICTDDEKVDDCVEQIRSQCGPRQVTTVNMPYMSGTGMLGSSTMPMDVEIGGATIIVVPVDRFEKF